jgi:hypothetical protein
MQVEDGLSFSCDRRVIPACTRPAEKKARRVVQVEIDMFQMLSDILVLQRRRLDALFELKKKTLKNASRGRTIIFL